MAAVLAAITAQGGDALMLDQRAYAQIDAELAVDGEEVNGWISAAGHRTDLHDVSGYYLRPYPAPPQAASSEAIVAAEQLLVTLAEIAPSRTAVVNRPSAMATNDSKPAQAAIIQSAGFSVPDTVVTSDRSVVEAFCARHDVVIYKSTSGIRSIVKTLRTTDHARLEHLATCPTQFQELIQGDDYRVHVAGDQLFTTRVTSHATDYRYAANWGAEREMTTATLPSPIEERCLSLTRRLGLLVESR